MKVSLGPARELVLPHHGLRLSREAGGWRSSRFTVSERGSFAVVQSLPPLPPPLLMSGWVDGEEQDILEDWLAGTARPNVPSHIMLFTTTPADDATGGVEVAAGDYGRVALARNGTNWGNFTAGAPTTADNLVAITWSKATSNWGTVASWGYNTAATAGILLLFAVLGTAKAINTDDTAEIAVGDAVVKLGDPGDTF